MDSYLVKLDSTPADQRWPILRGWMDSEPLELYAELRKYRPVLTLPEVTLVTRYADCASVLRQYDAFSVALYAPKQGSYWMPLDGNARHWREKSIMRALLDLEELAPIRSFVGERTALLLQAAAGAIDVPQQLSRAIPIAMVQTFFGFDESDPAKLIEWSYWSQQDTFHNQPFDTVVVDDPELITSKRMTAKDEMGAYLGQLLQRRAQDLQAGIPRNDPATRLLKLAGTGAVKLTPELVALNVGGLLIGAVETTSHAVNNALAWLLENPAALAQAQSAANGDDLTLFDGCVFEALRFRPAFPYFFRTCETASELASGTDYATPIERGTTVLAVTHSAMFDESIYTAPQAFDPRRSSQNNFHFGQGLHECLGRHIGAVMVPEIVRQLLLLDGLSASGPVEYHGGVPDHYHLSWNHHS